MSDQAETQFAITYKLMSDLLKARGKHCFNKGHQDAATDTEITTAFQEATKLVNNIVRG